MPGSQKKQQMLFPCLEEDRNVVLGNGEQWQKQPKRLGCVKVKQSTGRHRKAKDPDCSLGNQQDGSACLPPLVNRSICLLMLLFLKLFQNSGGTNLVSEDARPVVPTRKERRKGPACVFLFYFC